MLLTLGVIFWSGMAQPASAERPSPDLAVGQAEYLRSCARCHGVEGRGDGRDAKRFYPRPRDFSLGVYKFRSTASGTPPTDEDLFQAITRGLPGSNMPDWAHLDEDRRWQLVYYLKSLSTFFEEVEPEPIAMAPDPGPKGTDLAKGSAVYVQLGCAACHGPQGRANGPSAATLVDDWDQPIRPVNLTQGWNYRGWKDPESIMMRFLTGIDGSGMPSYVGAVSPEDAWHLAYYVVSLQEEPHWTRIARATHLEGALPESLDDPRWDTVKRTDVRLRNVVTVDGEWVAPPSVSLVSFQVLYNDEAAAFRLGWDDPSEDREGSTDAFAMLLKPDETQGDVVTLQAWPYVGAPRLDICYWSASTDRTFESVASDFESMRRVGARRPVLKSQARYDDGRWQMVLQRPLTHVASVGAAVIRPEAVTSVAFAVWDGGNPGERAVSPWTDLALQPLQPAESH